MSFLIIDHWKNIENHRATLDALYDGTKLSFGVWNTGGEYGSESGKEYMGHLIMGRLEHHQDMIPEPMSNMFFPVVNMLKQLCDDHELQFNTLCRSCLNWVYPIVGNNDLMCESHIDHQYQHTQVLWYLNDCDGDTLLYIGNDTVRITPKKDRMLVFNGLIQHTAEMPTQGMRKVLITTFT
jgi:hypothetical protein